MYIYIYTHTSGWDQTYSAELSDTQCGFRLHFSCRH